jgi:hypothetical protein
MKKTLFICCLVFSSFVWGQSQSHEFTIDYTVRYLVDNAKKGTKDTVTVGFEKNGKYLWSDYNGIAEGMASGIAPGLANAPGSTSNFVYASESGKVFMAIFLGPINMMMDMDIKAIFQQNVTEEDQFNEDLAIRYQKSKDKFRLNKKKYPIYDIYSKDNGEDDSSFKLAIDNSIDMNNTKLLQNFFELMISSTNSSGNIQGELPNGLILSVIDSKKNTMLLEAISVDHTPLTISLNNSFKISE